MVELTLLLQILAQVVMVARVVILAKTVLVEMAAQEVLPQAMLLAQ
jgi:hypothetical protein